MTFAYVIKVRDETSLTRPNLYFHGWGERRWTERGMIAPAQFSHHFDKAFVVEASTLACAKMVADILAKQVSTPSWRAWVARIE